MNWSQFKISDDKAKSTTAISYGSGYYIAVNVYKSGTDYKIDIYYTRDPAAGWEVKTIKNSGADHISIAGIEFVEPYFVIPYTTENGHNFGILYSSAPNEAWLEKDNVFSYTRGIQLNSVRFAGQKLIVCGAKSESDTAQDISGWVWYCTDPTAEWHEYCVVAHSEHQNGNVYASDYNVRDTSFNVYAVAVENNTTNKHLVYASSNLNEWQQPRTITTDTRSALPHPAFVYCEDYNAICLFSHGYIYISKNGNDFVKIKYPAAIEEESIRTCASDGTRIIASSAADNQSDLKVIYSSGDPAKSENWQVDILDSDSQVSTNAHFIQALGLFLVLGGTGVNACPAMYTAPFNIGKFKRMKDRVPTYPGRVELTPVEGEQNKYILKRADEPTDEGTKLGKAALLSDDAAIAVWNNTPPSRICTPSTALEHLGGITYHVGDILTTVRDLSTDDNWLKCDGSEIDATKYPALADLFGGAVIPSEWEKTISVTQSQSQGTIFNLKALTDRLLLFEYVYGSSSGVSQIYVRSSTDGQNLQSSGSFPTNTNDIWLGDHGASNGSIVAFLGSHFFGWYKRPEQSGQLSYGSTSFAQSYLPAPSLESGQRDTIANSYITYGNGYWLTFCYTEGTAGKAALLWYGTSPNSMSYKITSQSTGIDSPDYIYGVAAGNGLFAYAVLRSVTRNFEIGYSTSPGGSYTFLAVNTFSDSKPAPGQHLHFLNNIWILFYPGGSKIGTKADLKDGNTPWQIVEPPSIFAGATISSIEYAAGSFLLIGKRNGNWCSWSCISLTDVWHEVIIGPISGNSLVIGPAYFQGSWWVYMGGGSSGYLCKKTNNTPPNVPLIPDDGKVRAYIKAKEGD